MTCRRRQQRGFSLVETLISVSLLAGIAMALTPALYSASKASARIQESATSSETIERGAKLFRMMVEQMITTGHQNSGQKFVGNPNRISFQTIDPISAEPVRVVYQLNRTEGGLVLQFSTEPRAKKYTVIARLSNARFRYYGAELRDASGTWRTSWSASVAPRLIQLEATGPSGAPILIEAAPQGDAPLHCPFDPVSRRCRRT